MPNKNPTRLDAQEAIFFNRELDVVKTKTYDTKFKALKAYSLFPVNTAVSSGAATITYRKYTNIGFAKFVQDYAKDFPRVDVYGDEITVKNYSIGASYGYSIKEVRQSKLTGKGLELRRATAARRAIEQKINQIAFIGDADRGMNGFIDYPGISEYTIPNDGTGDTKTWATKTPDQIVRDLQGIVAFIVESTNEVEMPDTLLLPIAKYLNISNLRMTGNSDKTVLQFFLTNNDYIKQIVPVSELKAAGAGATDRMMAYTRDAEHVTFEIPQPFEQFDAQQDGMSFKIPVYSETAGILVYYPMSICYADGI